ncbi:AAA family ATPase [Geobacter sp. AOG2]|uniref:AAA family ATPase n=1 Tax=Geobacter sp. AOG2 TaxID=1566347 RepID=UPI001CC7EBD7|nr:AAA family ATPase [Geobacter sp. AOG2]GFE60737.1 ATPase AAA [Geobacter sp. AOG2]
MENMTQQQMVRMISVGTIMFYVITNNEQRSEWLLSQVAARLKGMGSPLVWTCTTGLCRDGVVVADTADPMKALDFAIGHPGPFMLIMKDVHHFWWDSPILIRKLKDLASASNGKGKVTVILGDEERIPQGFREDNIMLTHGLPGIEEIQEFLKHMLSREPSFSKACREDPTLFGRLAVAARGLDFVDLERSIRLLRLDEMPGGTNPVASLLENKRRIIQQSGIMELVTDVVGCNQLGGMENLKHWLERRTCAFGLDSISSGVGLPRGVLVMGIAGCGKSLFVKSIAAEWHLPLIRLDMSTVYGGLFGTPEASLRLAFDTAEAVAPCVLWIDEIESGITTHGFKSEGGAASRVLGNFLTWMQEKREPVFVAATANAIEMLPAEVLRKGRFDEIFYVGLPDTTAREQIFRIHLAKRQVEPASFDIPLLAGSTRGFSGAEIEQTVNSAVFEALADRRPMTQQDLMVMISQTVPLSITMAEQIKKIEAWAFKRAVPASGKFR